MHVLKKKHNKQNVPIPCPNENSHLQHDCSWAFSGQRQVPGKLINGICLVRLLPICLCPSAALSIIRGPYNRHHHLLPSWKQSLAWKGLRFTIILINIIAAKTLFVWGELFFFFLFGRIRSSCCVVEVHDKSLKNLYYLFFNENSYLLLVWHKLRVPIQSNWQTDGEKYVSFQWPSMSCSWLLIRSSFSHQMGKKLFKSLFSNLMHVFKNCQYV